ELTTEDIRNTKAYKEYYACATGEATPKQKVSVRRKRGGSDSSTTPPTAVASPRPITTDDGNGEEDQGIRISEEERIQEEEEADELYCDVNINQGRGLQVSQDIEDSHVTLTPVHPDGQQESSSVSSFVTSMLNLTSDAEAVSKIPGIVHQYMT
nr:hypothetical protein [Tanacetum cinerariifolium]